MVTSAHGTPLRLQVGQQLDGARAPRHLVLDLGDHAVEQLLDDLRGSRSMPMCSRM